MFSKRKQRVRVHLVDDHLPSVEGILLERRPEFVIGRPSLIHSAEGGPAELVSREVVIPRERVAFYEVLT